VRRPPQLLKPTRVLNNIDVTACVWENGTYETG
jgi:hypothetical protein